MSANALAGASGVPQPTITRFLAGAEMKSATIDKLAAYFGLALQSGDPSAAAKAKVNAPAMPAVDWGGAEPKKKRKAEPPPGPPAKGAKRRK